MTDGDEQHEALRLSCEKTVAAARQSQQAWKQTTVIERLKPIAEMRTRIADDPTSLAKRCGRDNLAESLAGEILPVADACLFLEKQARAILKPKRLGSKGRPQWLFGVGVELRREPVGVVLIVAPSNYPFMLPGIQTIQALIAGNAVLIKPAVGCSEPANALAELLHQSGIEPSLVQVLPESVSAVEATVKAGINKVVLTGSATTGRAVQTLLADSLTPSAMELSGCDAVFVTASADLDRVVKCLRLGLTFNSGRTCIAPRRIFVDRTLQTGFQEKLLECFSAAISESQNDPTSATIAAAKLVDAATDGGAELLLDGIEPSSTGRHVASATIVTNASVDSQLLKTDIFAPVMSIVACDSIDEAVAMNDKCPYALGATVFSSDAEQTETICRQINAGCIVVNDMIVPTADPRVPFGGRGESGFGVTRGAAGLEEMTNLKAIIRRKTNWLPHLDAATPHDADVLAGLIKVMHATNPLSKMKAGIALAKSSLKQRNYRKQNS